MKNKIIIFLSTYFIISYFFTLFISLIKYINPDLRFITFFIPFILLYILKNNLKNKSDFVKPTAFLLIFSVFSIITNQFFTPQNSPLMYTSLNITHFSLEFIFFISVILFIFILVSSKENKEELLFPLKYFYNFQIINYIISILLLVIIDSTISRQLAAGSYSIPFIPVSSYSIVYMSVFITIFLFSKILSGELRNKYYIFIFLLSLIFVTISGFFIALALILIGMILIIYFNLNRKNKIITLISLTFFAIIFLFTSLGYNSLFFLANLIGDAHYTTTSKLIELANMLQTGEIGLSITSRLEVYMNNINAIIETKGMGTFIFNQELLISNHSTILYTFATTGIFGTLLLLYSIYLYFNYFYKKLSNEKDKNLWKIINIIFLLLMLLNPVFSSPAIFIAVYLVIPYLFLKNNV